MGRHTFRIREISLQAGLSEATVDRVLNNRGNVRASTEREVYQAIADLERQRTQLRLGGRTFVVDVVMQTPERFSTAVRSALEAELPSLRPAVIRARFHFRETGSAGEIAATLDRLPTKRSQGVILKAPAAPEIAAATSRLVEAGIPVVTLVTDIPGSRRLAYVGMDNRAAGATAAYLLAQWLRTRPGNVLVTLSSTFFRGEEEREMGFRATMGRLQPHRRLIDVTESDGLDRTQHDLVLGALTEDPAFAPCTPSVVATSLRSPPSMPSTVPAWCSSATTSTMTTPGCCVTAGCRRCCTTNSTRTCGAPARSSCRRTGHCRDPSCPGRRTSR